MARSATLFDPNTFDITQLFATNEGGGMIFRYYGYPRQRGGSLFRVLAKYIPRVLKNPHVRSVARKAAKHIGGFLADKAPQFSASPLGQQVGKVSANLLSDLGEGKDMAQSLKTNARAAVREMTGLGKKRKRTMRKSATKPVAFIHRRSSKIVM